MSVLLEKVRRELARYAHPLFAFDAREGAAGVEVLITCKAPEPVLHTYSLLVHAREIESPQFAWSFQKQLYDCLHDYVVEMFTDNPQRKETAP
jgi:hypothetical protein